MNPITTLNRPLPPTCPSWCQVTHLGPEGWDYDTSRATTKTCRAPFASFGDAELSLERFAEIDAGKLIVSLAGVRLIGDLTLSPCDGIQLSRHLAAACVLLAGAKALVA